MEYPTVDWHEHMATLRHKRSQLLDVIDKPMTADEIADKLDVKSATLKKWANKLVDKGKLQKQMLYPSLINMSIRKTYFYKPEHQNLMDDIPGIRIN
jgi:predicted transcriptional regulator